MAEEPKQLGGHPSSYFQHQCTLQVACVFLCCVVVGCVCVCVWGAGVFHCAAVCKLRHGEYCNLWVTFGCHLSTQPNESINGGTLICRALTNSTDQNKKYGPTYPPLVKASTLSQTHTPAPVCTDKNDTPLLKSCNRATLFEPQTLAVKVIHARQFKCEITHCYLNVQRVNVFKAFYNLNCVFQNTSATLICFVFLRWKLLLTA